MISIYASLPQRGGLREHVEVSSRPYFRAHLLNRIDPLNSERKSQEFAVTRLEFRLQTVVKGKCKKVSGQGVIVVTSSHENKRLASKRAFTFLEPEFLGRLHRRVCIGSQESDEGVSLLQLDKLWGKSQQFLIYGEKPYIGPWLSV